MDAYTTSIDNAGTISTYNAFSTSETYSYSIVSDEKVEITNSGTIKGSISTATYANTFVNESGGLFETGIDIDLSNEGTLTNAGTISPGGEDNIFSSTITGNLSTDETDGTYLFDVDIGENEADYLTFYLKDTNEFEVTGQLDVNLTGTSLLSSGDEAVVDIMYAENEFSSDAVYSTLDISDLTVTDTTTVDYTIFTRVSDQYLRLTATVDYTPDSESLSDNEQAVGDYMDDLVTVAKSTNGNGQAAAAPGDGNQPDYGFVRNLTGYVLQVESIDELLDGVYGRLGPGEIFTPAQTSTMSSLRFIEQLNSCPAVNEEGVAVFTKEGSCVWASAEGVYHERGEDLNVMGYIERLWSLSGGVQVEIAEDWFLGGALNYERTFLSADDFSGEGYRIGGGAVLKKQFGATTISASASGGYGHYDHTRTVFTPHGLATVNGSPESGWVAANARVGHAFAMFDTIRVEPSASLTAQYFHQSSYDENGQNTYGLKVDEFDDTQVYIRPQVDVGKTFTLGGLAMEASAHGGIVAFLDDTEMKTNVSLLGVGATGPGFTLRDGNDRLYGEIGAALKGQLSKSVNFEVSGDVLFSENHREFVGAGRFNINF